MQRDCRYFLQIMIFFNFSILQNVFLLTVKPCFTTLGLVLQFNSISFKKSNYQ